MKPLHSLPIISMGVARGRAVGFIFRRSVVRGFAVSVGVVEHDSLSGKDTRARASLSESIADPPEYRSLLT